ncbi:MAG: biopolymer transporter ExbD [Gammaproteobacteria bacterium]
MTKAVLRIPGGIDRDRRRSQNLLRLRSGTAEINVVPFIDVVLVLLIVFMIGAPLAAQGVAVQLPATRTSNLGAGAQSPVVVTVTRAGEYSIMIGGEQLSTRSLEQIGRHLEVLNRRGLVQAVVVKADAQVSYQKVAALLTEVRFAGIRSVGLATQITPEPQNIEP